MIIKYKFNIFGNQYAFTRLFDYIRTYSIGCVYMHVNEYREIITTDNRVYWHKVFLGIYRKSNNWIK